MNNPTLESEEILLRVGAGHVVKPETVFEKAIAYLPTQLITGVYGHISLGGHLHITSELLYHQPHALNPSNSSSFIQIPIQDIKHLEAKQRGLAALLEVHTTSGETVKFVCWGRKKVMETIANLQNNQAAS